MADLTKEEKKEMKKEVKQVQEEEVQKTDEMSYILDDSSLDEKISQWFNKISILSLDDEGKQKVAQDVKTNAAWDRLYWIEIILSSIIATLGLLNNSVAVVIGAMLIAPLLRPIHGLSFAVARWWEKIFLKSSKTLLYSMGLSVLFAYIVTSVLGIQVENNEIASRISPNILDFFIAIFSAAVAVLSLRFARLSESVAGVALAASLMPPLAVIWIQLALGHFGSAFGALTLFLANLSAIIFVGMVFFWLYWFTPHLKQLQTQSFHRIGVVLVGITLILIPLVLSFNSIKKNYSISQSTSQILLENVSSEIYDIEVSDVYTRKDKIHIDVLLRLETGTQYQAYISDIKQKLNEKFPYKNITFIIRVEYIDIIEVTNILK